MPRALRGSFLAAASTKPCGRQPLLFQRCSLPFACKSLCCSGAQACRLPAFKPLKRLKCSAGRLHQALWPSAPAVPALQPAVCLQKPLLFGRSSLPFASLQALKTLKMLRRPFAPSPVAVSPCCSSVAACRLPAKASVVRALKPAVCQPSNP